MRKYFGTDGVRGIANTELDAALAYKLGQAAARILKDHSSHQNDRLRVLIGTDTRLSKDLLTFALSAGFMSMGADIWQAGVLPTPGVAALTRKYQADIGAVISASHNPAEFNGIKFFNAQGFKLSDEIELAIECSMENLNLKPTGVGSAVGRCVPCPNALQDYADFLRQAAPKSLQGLSIILDTANGAACQVAPELFRSLGAKIEVIAQTPDGLNINQACGSTHPQALCQKVRQSGADIGFAYDGDADRLIAVDEQGRVVDGDAILLILAKALKEKGQLAKDSLVVTVMSNLGLHRAARKLGIQIASTQVGDRYVLEEMQRQGYSLGGEQSGHMIFLDHNTTGDGILSSLLLAGVLQESRQSLSQAAKILEIYPQVLINAQVSNDKKHHFQADPQICQAIEKIEKDLEGEGRVLIRPSGTEPLVRVMLEGKDQALIEQKARALASLIEQQLG